MHDDWLGFKYLKEPATIVEVGSFTGSISLEMAKKFPSATIYAIEACPENFAKLLGAVLECRQIKPVHLAISDIDGSESLFVAHHPKYKGASSQSNSLFRDFINGKEWAKSIREVSVASMTLDHFCSKMEINSIDLLKVNCEGCEYKVFNGPLNFLQKTSFLALEMHRKSKCFRSKEYETNRQNIQKAIKAAGFTLVCCEQRHGHHVKQLWRSNGT